MVRASGGCKYYATTKLGGGGGLGGTQTETIQNFHTPTFLTLSKNYKMNRIPTSLLSSLQRFDLHPLFLRISLPVSNSLQQGYR